MSTIIEAFFLCLLASMVWAPIVFLTANRFAERSDGVFANTLWPVALIVAALPAIFAPVAAALGLSLRSNAPLPPMAALEAPVVATTTAPIEMTVAPTASFNLAAAFEAAAVLYFYGFVMFLILGVARTVWFSYRVHYAFAIDEPKLEAGLEEWRRRIGVKRRPRYAFTDAVSSVCVHGFFRPVILMPLNLLDRVPLKDAILMGAHEMAHIKRGDTILFGLCTAARAVFWFNPFMQRIAACANLAAEQAADALVIECGAKRRDYAHCFVQGLRFAAGRSQLGRDLVPSFTPFDKRSRRERLNAILSNTERRSLLSLSHKIGLAISIMAAAALAFAQAAFAVAPSPASEALPTAPVKGTITMSFGETSGVLGKDRPSHEGVDIKAARGSFVRAAGDGKVTDATERYRGQTAWGNVVVIDHGHGLVTRYAHLDSYRVKKGDTVDAGDVIGVVGSTGRSTGPHLHFEVIQDGLAIDPAPVLAAEPMSAPAPLSEPAPRVEPAPPAAVTPPTTLGAQLEQQLTGRLQEIDEKIANAFSDLEFSGFEDLDITIGEFDFDRLDDVKTFVMSELDHAGDWNFLSDEDREEIRAAQREAKEIMRDAERQMRQMERENERAEKERERALERAERDRERAERNRELTERERERAREAREREHERAEREAERAREQTEYQIERAIARAEAQAEREMERAEREWARMIGEDVEIDEREILALEEKALAEAQAELEEQLREIRRQREELDRQNRSGRSN